jgi:hypothetical protein
MILARADGDSMSSIAEDNGVTRQRVHQIVVNEARQYLDRLELELLKNIKTDDLVLYVIPYNEDYSTAIAFFDWTVARLRERDVKVKVHHRKSKEGVVFALEDVTPYGRRSSA